MSWSPTRGRIAVLVAYRGAGGSAAPSPLRVLTLDANGAGMAALAPDGSCACGGWAPDLTWSPDGTVAVYSRHGGVRHTLDADGTSVRVRFVRGSGWLVWQPR